MSKSKKGRKDRDLGVPVEKHDTAAWANIEKKKSHSQVTIPWSSRSSTPRNMWMKMKSKKRSKREVLKTKREKDGNMSDPVLFCVSVQLVSHP